MQMHSTGPQRPVANHFSEQLRSMRMVGPDEQPSLARQMAQYAVLRPPQNLYRCCWALQVCPGPSELVWSPRHSHRVLLLIYQCLCGLLPQLRHVQEVYWLNGCQPSLHSEAGGAPQTCAWVQRFENGVAEVEEYWPGSCDGSLLQSVLLLAPQCFLASLALFTHRAAPIQPSTASI